LKLIDDLYTGTSTRVKLGQKLSPRFMTFSGVRQGCVLAPALFSAAIDFIIYIYTSLFTIDTVAQFI